MTSFYIENCIWVLKSLDHLRVVIAQRIMCKFKTQNLKSPVLNIPAKIPKRPSNWICNGHRTAEVKSRHSKIISYHNKPIQYSQLIINSAYHFKGCSNLLTMSSSNNAPLTDNSGSDGDVPAMFVFWKGEWREDRGTFLRHLKFNVLMLMLYST